MIRSSKETTLESFNRIKEGQNGGFRPLKTRFEHFNEITHGGIGKQRIYTLGGLSSFGKSHTLRQIEEDIFNQELNPNSKQDVILCKIDFEMTKEEAILNRVQAKTKKPFKELLYSEPDEETKKAFNEVYLELNSDHIYETFDTYKPENLYQDLKIFCEQHKDKKQIVITIDNSNLINTEGSDETTALSNLQTALIKLKREVKNISIIQLAQLNREIKQRTTPKDMFPRTSDFFNSSKLEHATDVMIVVHNPYLMGYMEYGAVNHDKNSYLDKYLEPKNKYSTFRTKGLIFWHYVKVRSKNDLKNFKDVFIEEIFEVDKNDSEVNNKPSFTIETPTFTTPVFEKEPYVPPNFDLKSAFESDPF
jgi:replicative DNA helicase